MVQDDAPMEVLSSTRGGVRLSRRVRRGEGGKTRLLQDFEGNGRRVIVTHAASIIAEVEVLGGQVRFPLASGVVHAPERFRLSVPPRTALPIEFVSARVTSDGIASFADHPLATAIGDTGLDPDGGVPPSVVRARKLLHDRLADPAPVRSVSREVGLAPETLARLFSRAYVVTPKEYVHRARLFAALLRILEGARIADSALESGFGDLSRFYRQFRRVVGATPGEYARIRKRQDARIDREV